jgi:hypothetical protein
MESMVVEFEESNDWEDDVVSSSFGHLIEVVELLTLFESQPYLVSQGRFSRRSADVVDAVFHRIASIDAGSGRPRWSPPVGGRPACQSFFLGRDLVTNPGYFDWKEVLQLCRGMAALHVDVEDINEAPEGAVGHLEDGRLHDLSSADHLALIGGAEAVPAKGAAGFVSLAYENEEEDFPPLGSLDPQGLDKFELSVGEAHRMGVRGGPISFEASDLVPPCPEVSEPSARGPGLDQTHLRTAHGCTVVRGHGRIDVYLPRKRGRFLHGLLESADNNLRSAGIVPDSVDPSVSRTPALLGILSEKCHLSDMIGDADPDILCGTDSRSEYMTLGRAKATTWFAARMGLSVMNFMAEKPTDLSVGLTEEEFSRVFSDTLLYGTCASLRRGRGLSSAA